MRYVFAILCVFAAALCIGNTESVADCRSRVVVSSRSVVVPVQVQTALVADFVPIALPAYNVAYGSNDALLRKVLEKLEALEAQMAALKGGPLPAMARPIHPGARAMEKHCAACHSAETGKPPKQPVLFDAAGKFLDTDDNYKRVVGVLDSGSMPPKTKARPSAEESFHMLRYVITKEEEPKK